MHRAFTEHIVEQAGRAWSEGVGWQVRNGAEIAPGEQAAQHDDIAQFGSAQRPRDASMRTCIAVACQVRDAEAPTSTAA